MKVEFIVLKSLGWRNFFKNKCFFSMTGFYASKVSIFVISLYFINL